MPNYYAYIEPPSGGVRFYLFNYEGIFKVIKCPEFCTPTGLDPILREFATGLWDFGITAPVSRNAHPSVRLREGGWFSTKEAALRIPNFQDYLYKVEALELLV